jgi:hypothetical protein
MNKVIGLILMCAVLSSTYEYNGSTTAAVTLSAGIIKSQNTNTDKKYKRKDCPVCKGKGYYISGDGIKKVDCGYCEPDSSLALEKSGTCKTITIKK